MVVVGSEDAVVPEEGDVAGVLADLVEQLLAEEVGFVFCLQVHVVAVAQRAVHDGERMEGERRELHRAGIDPAHGTRGLQTEARPVGERHGEVVRDACIGEGLHIVDRATEVVTAVKQDRVAVRPLRC